MKNIIRLLNNKEVLEGLIFVFALPIFFLIVFINLLLLRGLYEAINWVLTGW